MWPMEALFWNKIWIILDKDTLVIYLFILSSLFFNSQLAVDGLCLLCLPSSSFCVLNKLFFSQPADISVSATTNFSTFSRQK